MLRKARFAIGLSILAAGLWFFVAPGATVCWYIATDKGLSGDGVSTFAYSRHQRISDDYARYARERIGSGKPESLKSWQIAETEWPLFGSAFYLWSTESFQKAWEKNPDLSKEAPKVYAREAIDAAKDLILDPGHAKWVQDHWGKEAYLTRENVFYRMLMMSAIISHHHLTDSDDHFELLRAQSNSLAQELDESFFGLLDDYPGQCYPTDVVAAIGAIQRADVVLQEDHSEMIQRASRMVTGNAVAPYGLPPYAADAESGRRFDNSRGCGNSYFTTFAPPLWPDQDPGWYAAYTEHFWQENGFCAGFREFPHGAEDTGAYYMDVDAGPVFYGLGTAATAFGIGAARVNGRFDHASTLSYEMIAASWPLPNGTLLFPRMFSNGDHAPYLGEMAILFQLSREPVHPEISEPHHGRILGCVWLMLLGYIILSWITCKLGGRIMRGK
jgi:hypothetical protein